MILFKKHIFLLLVTFMAVAFVPFNDDYKLTTVIDIQGDFIRSDELGNVFVVKDNQLTKFDENGKKLHSYSNLYAGDISFVDTHDPFKILLLIYHI